MKEQQDALKLLIEGIGLAQSRGAYSLKEAAILLGAVETFTNNQDTEMQPTTTEVIDNQVIRTTTEVVTPETAAEEQPEQAQSNDPVEGEAPAEQTPEQAEHAEQMQQEQEAGEAHPSPSEPTPEA